MARKKIWWNHFHGIFYLFSKNFNSFSRKNFTYLNWLLSFSSIFSILNRSLRFNVSGVEYPPRKPAPSANANSSSIVAPPKIYIKIYNLNLKYEIRKFEIRNPKSNIRNSKSGYDNVLSLGFLYVVLWYYPDMYIF